MELPYTVKGMDVSFSGILSFIEVSPPHQTSWGSSVVLRPVISASVLNHQGVGSDQ